VAEGPVVGERRVAGEPAGQQPQKLLGERLEGNTQSQIFNLLGAVQLEDAARGQRFAGRDLQLDLSSQSGSTNLPFQISQGSLRATGSGLTVQGAEAVATITKQCHVEQPGDQLDADRCQWHWRSGAVSAEGSVVLQRAVNRQISRAALLQGNLQEEGRFTISAPGGRVISRFQVKSSPR
jgi:hypothetical protein